MYTTLYMFTRTPYVSVVRVLVLEIDVWSATSSCQPGSILVEG